MIILFAQVLIANWKGTRYEISVLGLPCRKHPLLLSILLLVSVTNLIDYADGIGDNSGNVALIYLCPYCTHLAFINQVHIHAIFMLTICVLFSLCYT